MVRRTRRATLLVSTIVGMLPLAGTACAPATVAPSDECESVQLADLRRWALQAKTKTQVRVLPGAVDNGGASPQPASGGDRHVLPGGAIVRVELLRTATPEDAF